jgi:hypothetical protein
MSYKATKRRRKRDHELTDNEVKAILTQAMVKAGATAAAIYAYNKTDVILTMDNEDRLPRQHLRAWDAAINEYHLLIAGPTQ